MAVGDVLQANIIGQLHGQTTVNTMHYVTNEVGATPDAQSLTLALEATLIPKIKAATSNEWSLVKTVVQKIRPLPPAIGYESTTLAGPGFLFTESLPTSVAVVVTKRTTLAERKYRGRCYFAGVSATHEIDSQVTTVGLGLWNDVAEVMESFQISGGYIGQPVVFHRAAGDWTPIDTCIARSVLRNQRRRQVGKGV